MPAARHLPPKKINSQSITRAISEASSGRIKQMAFNENRLSRDQISQFRAAGWKRVVVSGKGFVYWKNPDLKN